MSRLGAKFPFSDMIDAVNDHDVATGISRYADAHDTTVDSSTALAALFADRSYSPSVAPMAWPYEANELGGTWSCIRIGSPVDIPADKHLIGHGNLTGFRPLAGLTGPMFRANTDADGTPTVELFIGLSSIIQRLQVVNRDQSGAEVTGVTAAFTFAGQMRFADIYSLGFRRLLQQAPNGNAYSDQTVVERIRSMQQPDDGTVPLIDLRNNGDAAWINSVANDSPVDPTGAGRAMRGYTLYIRSRNSATIRGIINGDVVVNASTGVKVSNLYFEQGQVRLVDSDAVLESSTIYMRGDQTGGVDDPVAVVPVKFAKANTAGAPVAANSYAMRDMTFVYQKNWSHPYGSKDNFEAGYGLTLEIERAFRLHRTVGIGDYTCLMGVTQAQSDEMVSNSDTAHIIFRRYSHLASLRSRWMQGGAGGAVAKGQWHIEAKLGDNQATVGLESVELLTTTGASANAKWAQPTATYYYRAAILQDQMRAIGVLGSAELSIAVTNGVAQIPALKLDPRVRGKPVLVRIWRGTASGNYSNYVTVPVIAGGALIDNGADLNGVIWNSWSGAAGTCNGNTLTKGYELQPGVWDTGYEAYGRVRVWTDTNTPPVEGAWRAGDEVLLRTPVAEGGKIKLGWRRLTDDNDWGHNGLFSYWLPLYGAHPIGYATTSELSSATSNINVRFKSQGVMVFNTTVGKPMFANGPLATSTWTYADGTLTITPA